jgi:hypothetical protein
VSCIKCFFDMFLATIFVTARTCYFRHAFATSLVGAFFRDSAQKQMWLSHVSFGAEFILFLMIIPWSHTADTLQIVSGSCATASVVVAASSQVWVMRIAVVLAHTYTIHLPRDRSCRAISKLECFEDVAIRLGQQVRCSALISSIASVTLTAASQISLLSQPETQAAP